MAKEGTELGVELSELWLCGRSYFPSAAAATADANRIVSGTSGDASIFARPGVMPGIPGVGSVTGDVYPVWDEVRDELQRILAEAADNLYAVGDALVRVADTYAATDAAAEAEMERLKTRYVLSDEFPLDDPTVRPPLYQPE
jgi:hypothetical protein